MADQKPPRVSGDERATLTALLQYQRDSFVRKCTGVSDGEAAKSRVASGTSLLWLANHMADAEATWVLVRFAGRDAGGSISAVTTEPAATISGALDRYCRQWSAVDGVAAASSLGDLCRASDADPVPDLRWVLAHLLEETARHAGHADIIRELIDGTTGR